MFVTKGEKFFVDTAFISAACAAYPGASVRHIGFGEFVLETPEGECEFDRMRGEPFEGMSGRPHAFYDSKGGTELAAKVVAAVAAATEMKAAA